MMRVLLICDNVIVYKSIKNIFDKNITLPFSVDYKYTSSNLSGHGYIFTEENLIDLKTFSEEIISTYDLVISAHCHQIFPKKLVEKIRCINIHPGYNPNTRGVYPQVFSILNNLKVGVTIHEMDEKFDNGPIIIREEVEKYSWDTSSSLYKRILEKEIELFDLYFTKILYNQYQSVIPENVGVILTKKDFNNLCEINLDEITTAGQTINKLRALSHENYNNAFFKDENGQKIFVKIYLEKE